MAKQVYNRIYTKEKWDKVNIYNKNLMEDFLLECKSLKKSENTIKQYRNDIRILFIYVLDQLDNKKMYELNKKSFRNYTLWLQEKGMSNARINRLMSATRSMLEYASNEEDYEDELEINYAAKVKGLKKEKARDIVFLTDEEIHIIYNKLIEKKLYSQALLCGFMYDTCSRRNEVYQVKRYDIDLNEMICKNPIVGKGGKTYRPIYHDLTKEAYALLEKNRTDEYDTLWLTHDGTPASYESLYAWVISWRKILENETEVYKEFNPHSWRHSAANNLENGTHYLCATCGKLSLGKIQKLMNHSDISTTQGYLEDKTEDELLSLFM